MRITFFMSSGTQVSGRFGDGAETGSEILDMLTTVRKMFLNPEGPEGFSDENGVTVLLEPAHVIYMKGEEGGV